MGSDQIGDPPPHPGVLSVGIRSKGQSCSHKKFPKELIQEEKGTKGWLQLKILSVFTTKNRGRGPANY